MPCDFGVETLHNQLHGNVDIKLIDCSKMRVSSLILSWNNEVFIYVLKITFLMEAADTNFSNILNITDIFVGST